MATTTGSTLLTPADSSTEVFNAGQRSYNIVILENLGAVKAWFSFNGPAVNGQGFSLEPAGADGSKIVIQNVGRLPPVLNGIAISGTATIAWHQL